MQDAEKIRRWVPPQLCGTRAWLGEAPDESGAASALGGAPADSLELRAGSSGWADPGARERVARMRDQMTKQLERLDGQLARLGDEDESSD